MRNLGSTASLETENRNRYPERIAAVADKLKKADAAGFTASMENRSVSGPASTATSAAATSIAESGTSVATGGEGTGTAGAGAGAGKSNSASRQAMEIRKACDAVVDIASEKIHEGITQVAKKNLFS